MSRSTVCVFFGSDVPGGATRSRTGCGSERSRAREQAPAKPRPRQMTDPRHRQRIRRSGERGIAHSRPDHQIGVEVFLPIVIVSC
jgi:hypothetical protein